MQSDVRQLSGVFQFRCARRFRNQSRPIKCDYLTFLGVHVRRDSPPRFALAAVAGHCVTLVKVRAFEGMISNQSVLALTDRTWALKSCMSLIPKGKENP